jgi:hypothetical protein
VTPIVLLILAETVSSNRPQLPDDDSDADVTPTPIFIDENPVFVDVNSSPPTFDSDDSTESQVTRVTRATRSHFYDRHLHSYNAGIVKITMQLMDHSMIN